MITPNQYGALAYLWSNPVGSLMSEPVAPVIGAVYRDVGRNDRQLHTKHYSVRLQ